MNRDVAPIADDIEPVGESRADVEVGNEEDEEPLEAENLEVRSKESRETKHEDSGHAVYSSWCAACVEGRGVGGQYRIIVLLEEEERERTTVF